MSKNTLAQKFGAVALPFMIASANVDDTIAGGEKTQASPKSDPKIIISDTKPRVETFKMNGKTYSVGSSYTIPATVAGRENEGNFWYLVPRKLSFLEKGWIQEGEMSWYGPGFYGNNMPMPATDPKTGKKNLFLYEKDSPCLEIAHKHAPKGAVFKLTATLPTGEEKSLIVQSVGRGPYGVYNDPRIVDATRATAYATGMLQEKNGRDYQRWGLVDVKIKALPEYSRPAMHEHSSDKGHRYCFTLNDNGESVPMNPHPSMPMPN